MPGEQQNEESWGEHDDQGSDIRGETIAGDMETSSTRRECRAMQHPSSGRYRLGWIGRLVSGLKLNEGTVGDTGP